MTRNSIIGTEPNLLLYREKGALVLQRMLFKGFVPTNAACSKLITDFTHKIECLKVFVNSLDSRNTNSEFHHRGSILQGLLCYSLSRLAAVSSLILEKPDISVLLRNTGA